jgi:hypothetical protein
MADSSPTIDMAPVQSSPGSTKEQHDEVLRLLEGSKYFQAMLNIRSLLEGYTSMNQVKVLNVGQHPQRETQGGSANSNPIGNDANDEDTLDDKAKDQIEGIITILQRHQMLEGTIIGEPESKPIANPQLTVAHVSVDSFINIPRSSLTKSLANSRAR